MMLQQASILDQDSLKRPYISVIIPSLDGKVESLERALASQTWKPDSVQVVKGVRPNGRARNLGVASTPDSETGADQILLFIDDDAYPSHPRLIEGLVRPLLENGPGRGSQKIGLTGAARILPKNASWFQRRVAAEIPRTVNPVPSHLLETNPPLEGYGHSLITTTCCAMWRSVYQEAGGFSNTLTSGVDTDFFYRVRRLGYRFVMIPEAYVEHPAPENLRTLLRKFHWYGVGYSQEVQRRPQQHMGPRLLTPFHRAGFLLAATLWLIPNIFILYSYGYPQFTLGFRPLKALSTYAVAWGYARGWKRGKK